MYFFKRLVFLFFPLIKSKSSQTYYKFIIRKNQFACVEADVNHLIAKRFDAKPGDCKTVGCNIFRGKQYIPFCCTVRGYLCN